VPVGERAAVVKRVTLHSIRAKEMQAVLEAVNWPALAKLGSGYRSQRLALLDWACHTLAEMPRVHPKEHIRRLALALPLRLPTAAATTVAATSR